MRILWVKTSSMGDLLHSFPAIQEAYAHYPDLSIDWVVEESFADIPTWHPAVKRVIPVALRRWFREGIWKSLYNQEWTQTLALLRQESYDYVIDAQGLWKSALWSCLARSERKCGFDGRSIREKGAHFFYHQRYSVSPHAHAIHRQRALMSAVLGYPFLEKKNADLSYGLMPCYEPSPAKKDIFFMHAHSAAWRTKSWPLDYWRRLAQYCIEAGYSVVLPSGNAQEYQQAQEIVQGCDSRFITLLAPGTSLSALKAQLLDRAAWVVSVDTGLGHLSAALGIPTIALYGATDPHKIGILGERVFWVVGGNLSCSPCGRRACVWKEPFPPCYDFGMVDKVWHYIWAHHDESEQSTSRQ